MRALTQPEAAAAAAWIDDLEAEIAERVADISVLNASTIKRVVSQAVIRVLRNPDGLRTYSRAIDDATFSGTIDSELSSGTLHLTDAEWDLLLPATSETVFTITPYGAL